MKQNHYSIKSDWNPFAYDPKYIDEKNLFENKLFYRHIYDGEEK
jgi:hypothetical protein